MGGGDKARLTIGGATILQRVLACIGPQCDRVVINANGDPARFADTGLPVVADSIPDFAGPLAGILAGLDWAVAAAPAATHLASFATDAPFLPRDLVQRLVAGLEGGTFDLSCAASDGRAHPVFGLWPVSLRGALRHALCDEDIRKVDRFTARYRLATIEFPTNPVDPFFNANRPEDLEVAERLLEG